MARQIFYSNLRRKNAEMPDSVKRLVELSGGAVDRENQNVHYEALDATRLVHLVVEQCCEMMGHADSVTITEIKKHFGIKTN